MDARTVRAVALADLIGFVSIGGVAWFLGFDPTLALVAGVVAGTACAAIIAGVALWSRRVSAAAATERAPSAPDLPDPSTDEHPTSRGDRG